MEPLDLALRIVLIGLCVIMFIVSVQAFKRAGGRRMVWVLLSFLGFTALSLLALLGEVFDDAAWSMPNAVVLFLILIIGANYLALLSVIIPQAIRNALPPYTNEFITMIKDSSLVMTIGVIELTLRGKLISAHTGQSIPVLIFVALLYFIMTFSASRIMKMIEKKFAIPGMIGSDSK
ncbi:MAG: hypothetical protein NT131_06265 [Methanomassiliicoccales archaeon]|nr:hypothetical protein [Methanomassiliicoccales archaeon]